MILQKIKDEILTVFSDNIPNFNENDRTEKSTNILIQINQILKKYLSHDKYKNLKVNREIRNVCSACGITANYLTCLQKYAKPPIKKAFSVSTFHTAICDICQEKTGVTEVRDFFYPDFTLIINQIQK